MKYIAMLCALSHHGYIIKINYNLRGELMVINDKNNEEHIEIQKQ